MASVCKDLFCQSKTEAAADGALIYKLCMTKLLEKFGPKPEEDFQKALKIIMTGLPSQAAIELRDTICQKKKKFDNCCCAYQVASVWKSILPQNIRAHIAHLDCINDFDNVLRTADCIYNATKQNVPVAAVKPAAAKPSPSATGGAARELDTSADAPAFDQINQLTEQLAAFNKNFKKRPKRGRGGQTRGAQQTRGGAGKPQSRDQGRGEPHPDGPPDNACGMQWRWGRSAYHCQSPDQCPWSHIAAPRPK